MTTGDLVFNPSGVSSAQKQEIGLTLFSIPYAFHSSSPVSIYVVRAISQNRLSNEACGQQGQNVYTPTTRTAKGLVSTWPAICV